MIKSKVSINDIANQLKISKTTVSFILNGKAKEKGISDKLVEKVLALTEELGYVPNQFAQSLRTGRTNIIGLLVEDISNQFFSTFARNIEEKAHKNGYRIIYCSTENNDKRARDFLKMFWNLGVDGCIVTPTIGLAKDIKAYADKGMNIILFDRFFKDTPIDYVVLDNEGGAFEGTTHLIRQGYRKVAFITIGLKLSQMEGRLKGYQMAMEEAGMEPMAFTLPYVRVKSEYVKAISNILKENSDLDGILAATNYVSITALEAISKSGLNIPKDIALVSFDDNELFRVYTPSISAIVQPIEEMSQAIVDTLLEKISNKGNKASRKGVIMSPSLIVRDSSLKNGD